MTRPPIDQQITFLYAEDAEASWRFYEEVMELPLVQDQGMVRIYAVEGGAGGGRAFLGVCRARGPRLFDDPRLAGGVILTLVTQEVEDWHAFLTEKGLDMPPPVYSEAHGITHFFFSDPAGYTLEVQRFERAGWPGQRPAIPPAAVMP
ncbi:VOC family protein [Roseococcus sp. SYP-B2431]|uniref:VOC family protein n=1 Tax=Roseococcus sp. SYP-B2431 TaxID=2496640 RepID=UPI001038FE1A|nr:VOC family protein [Roseococcus sp. SYP-B2431]TCH97440.1 VOC family protein [Roseococcus sp. SYP-B2431]